MKILHVSFSDINGGGAIGASRLHRAMKSRGLDSKMLVMHKNGADPTVTSVLNENNMTLHLQFRRATIEMCELYGLEDLPVRSFNMLGLDISHHINAAQPDIVQLHWVGNNTVKLSELKKIEAPIVWKMPDMWAFSGGEHYNRHGDPERWLKGYDKTKPYQGETVDLDRMVWEYKRRCYEGLRLTITSPSRFLADCAHRSVLLKSFGCHVIPNPLPWTFTNRKPATDSERRDIRLELGLPTHHILVAFAAYDTQERRKGYHHILAMVEKHLDRFFHPEELSFLVIGAEGRARRKVGKFNVQLFPATGYEDRYQNYLRACDLMLFPSEMDSTAMVVQESLALGIPSIVFDVGGLPEMVVHEKNGFLARPYEAKDLAKGLVWWKKLSPEQKQAARDFAAQRSAIMHNPGLCARRYLELYEAILDKTRRGVSFDTGGYFDVPDPEPAVTTRKYRAFVVDPSAVSNKDSSHNTEHSLAFVASMYASFIPTTLVINKEAVFNNPVGDTVKLFNWTMYDKIRAVPEGQTLDRMDHSSDASSEESCDVFDALCRLDDSDDFTDSDLVLFPTTDRFCIEGVLSFLLARSRVSMPSFHLNLMFEGADFLRGGYPLIALMTGLRESGYVDERIFLYAETEQMAQDLSETFNITVNRYSPPSVFNTSQINGLAEHRHIHDRTRETYAKCAAVLTANAEAIPDQTEGPTIAVVGRGRRDKGWALLPDIVAAYNKLVPANRATFVIQRPRAMDGLQAEEKALENVPNVILKDTILPAAELESIIANASVVMLPYESLVYHKRGSAFAWKAVTHAVPLVVTRNTALTEALITDDLVHVDELSETPGVGYQNGELAQSPEEFAGAIEKILTDYETYKKGAEQKRLRYFEESVIETVIKENLRKESFHRPDAYLIINQRDTDGEAEMLPEVSGFKCFLTVSEDVDASWRPITKRGLNFVTSLGPGGVLRLGKLPAPIREGLHNGRFREIHVSEDLAVRRGALRGWPQHLIHNLKIFPHR